eukprot:205191-Rhodomonas_salina.1
MRRTATAGASGTATHCETRAMSTHSRRWAHRQCQEGTLTQKAWVREGCADLREDPQVLRVAEVVDEQTGDRRDDVATKDVSRLDNWRRGRCEDHCGLRRTQEETHSLQASGSTATRRGKVPRQKSDRNRIAYQSTHGVDEDEEVVVVVLDVAHAPIDGGDDQHHHEAPDEGPDRIQRAVGNAAPTQRNAPDAAQTDDAHPWRRALLSAELLEELPPPVAELDVERLPLDDGVVPLVHAQPFRRLLLCPELHERRRGLLKLHAPVRAFAGCARHPRTHRRVRHSSNSQSTTAEENDLSGMKGGGCRGCVWGWNSGWRRRSGESWVGKGREEPFLSKSVTTAWDENWR